MGAFGKSQDGEWRVHVNVVKNILIQCFVFVLMLLFYIVIWLRNEWPTTLRQSAQIELRPSYMPLISFIVNIDCLCSLIDFGKHHFVFLHILSLFFIFNAMEPPPANFLFHHGNCFCLDLSLSIDAAMFEGSWSYVTTVHKYWFVMNYTSN